ncbi:MAG: hypothetical protein VX964_01325 [Verrucomicrobiota bacterium]|nr:hypothetical protein [Verrucomicrobiota bacterium]
MIYEYDCKAVLSRLKGPLKEILDAEMAAGNEILEISSKWPMPEVNVWFKNPLTDKYEKAYPSLQYSFLGDPKNWLEEYVDDVNGAMVAAKC